MLGTGTPDWSASSAMVSRAESWRAGPSGSGAWGDTGDWLRRFRVIALLAHSYGSPGLGSELGHARSVHVVTVLPRLTPEDNHEPASNLRQRGPDGEDDPMSVTPGPLR